MNSANREIRCDGCGAPATPEHLKRRLERLELATRYRPIHMECLVLHPAPPPQMEDYFYKPQQSSGKRSEQSRVFFDSLMAAAEVDIARERDEAALLGEFQRKGWYLAGCCECPLEESGIAPQEVAARFGETVTKRVTLSYKPKRVAFTSCLLEPLMKPLQNIGFTDVFPLKLEL